ncbi:MAG: DUF2752 domain-containing protein [Ignavibacteria bacterium]|nr:DUF2752 domain-containing protein [Ignavibacteria bacterium]
MWQKLSKAAKNPEFIIWIAALAYLGGLSPFLDSPIPFCIPSLFGFDSCWGCGIGGSITHVLHGDFVGSVDYHPLGILALGVIVYRLVTIYKDANRTVPMPIPAKDESAEQDSEQNNNN